MSKKFNVTDINKAIVGNIAKRVDTIEAKAEYNLRQIKLSEIKLSEKNNFGIRDIEELAESMKKYGQLHNAVVRIINDEEKKYEMISGERRYRAAVSLGWTSLACKIVEADDIEAEMLLIVANLDTRELNDMERSENARRLFELITEKRKSGEDFGGKKTRDIVAQKMNIAPATVQKLVGLKNLIPELQELVKDKGVGLELSNQWAQMPQDLQKLVYQSMKEGMTYTAKTAKELKDTTKSSESEEEYKKAIEDMKMKLKQKDEEIKEKDSKIKSTENELAITKAKSEKVEKELTSYKKELELRKTDIAKMKEELENKEKAMVENREKIRKEIEEEIKNNGDDNNPKVIELKEELERISKEHENFKTESENKIETMKGQVQVYEAKVKSVEKELVITKEQSKEEIDKLKEAEEKAQKELNTYKSRWEASKNTLADMRKKLEDKEKEIIENRESIRKEIKDEIESSGSDNNPKVKELKKKLQAITEEHENFKTESENKISDMKNQVEQYERQIKETEKVNINAKVIQGNMEIMALSKQAKQILNTLVTKLLDCKSDENFELKDETKKAIEEILQFGESLK